MEKLRDAVDPSSYLSFFFSSQHMVISQILSLGLSVALRYSRMKVTSCLLILIIRKRNDLVIIVIQTPPRYPELISGKLCTYYRLLQM